MNRRQLFFPLGLPLLLVFLIIPFLLAYIVLSVGKLLGFSPFTTLLLFLFILLGSTVNLPIYKLKQKTPIVENKRTNLFGFQFSTRPSKYIEVYLNLGGAIIPSLISLILLTSLNLTEIYSTIAATLIVVFVSYENSRLVKGGGIRIPMIIPPITAVIASLAMMSLFNASFVELAKVSYISGVTGVLIGADLLNLKKVQNLGVNMISVGGAGTFDGIFLTGVFAVLFSSLFVI